MLNQTPDINQPEAESDTYHEQDTLISIATRARRLSSLFLALGVVTALVIIFFLVLYIEGRASLDQFIYYFLIGLVPFFLGGFGWIALQFISEVIYLLMDIEDNTRPSRNPGT